MKPAVYRAPARSGPRKDVDAQRTRDQPWRRWYWTARWRKAAKRQLMIEPLCRMCAQAGRVTAGQVCDHVTPHKGDVTLFWSADNWQTLCKPCHDSAKQAIERGRGRAVIGLDGYPIENESGSQPACSPRRTMNENEYQ